MPIQKFNPTTYHPKKNGSETVNSQAAVTKTRAISKGQLPKSYSSPGTANMTKKTTKRSADASVAKPSAGGCPAGVQKFDPKNLGSKSKSY